MNFVNQYIVQAIITASNNLRLSSEKIEVVALMREYLSKSDHVEIQIKEMKKITSLSKLAIKLDEVYRFISNSKIDFLKISDRFKEHSHLLIRDLSTVLDVVTPQNMRNIIQELNEKSGVSSPQDSEKNNKELGDIKIRKPKAEITEREEPSYTEKYIMDDIKEDDEITFEDFEKAVLKPVKEIDNFLKKLESLNYTGEELKKYHELLETNTRLSEKVGFDIITNMHRILCNALAQIRENSLTPIKETVEGMRACLIVIVAIVRQKDVDIKLFLKKAENLGKSITAGRGQY